MSIITEKELIEILKVSRITIYERRKKGLPFLKMGKVIRYDLEKVLSWMADNAKEVIK